jgi:hypothetical protein
MLINESAIKSNLFIMIIGNDTFSLGVESWISIVKKTIPILRHINSKMHLRQFIKYLKKFFFVK